MIYYLAQKYSGKEKDAFGQAILWTLTLRNKGVTVFSPILHTHPFHQELLLSLLPYESEELICKKMNYVGWDLALCEGFLKGDGHETYTEYWCEYCGLLKWKELKTERQKSLYCDEILHRPTSHSYYDEEEINGYRCGLPVEPIDNEAEFDSGLTMLFAADCYKKQYIEIDHKRIEGARCKLLWESNGAFQEFDWAHEHHVKCLELEPFLEGKEVEI